jgi:hypothetical protein
MTTIISIIAVAIGLCCVLAPLAAESEPELDKANGKGATP